MKNFLLVLLLLIVVLLSYAATRPNDFQIARSIDIHAPPDQIIPFLEDFHRWGPWSPFEKLDPAMKRTFSGPAKGVGSIYEWSGNRDAGSGRMEIKQVSPDSGVVIQLDFTAPFEAHNIAEFRFAPDSGGTRVSWVMHGQQNFLMKVMGIFMSMDSMVGKQFESGLASLKTLCEAH